MADWIRRGMKLRSPKALVEYRSARLRYIAQLLQLFVKGCIVRCSFFA